MTPLLIIPDRSGSKRLPGKNTRMLCGKPLLQWTIDAAIESDIGKLAVSTDILDIAPSVHNWRPPDLCRDDTPIGDVVKFVAASNRHRGPIIVLQPTSPLRTAKDIKAAWDLFTGNGSLASYENVGKHQRLLTTNGAIWILQDDQTGFYQDPHSIYLMPRERSIDIDNEADFLLAEAILDKRLNSG